MAITTTAPAVFERVYVWELPVRLYHWVTVVSMLTLDRHRAASSAGRRPS